MLELFDLVEVAEISNKNYLDYVDRIVAENIVDKDTGDDLGITDGTHLTDELWFDSEFTYKDNCTA